MQIGEQNNIEDSQEEEEEERPLMTKKRKQMRRAIDPILEFLASHVIPRQQHPQEEVQRLVMAGKVQPLYQVVKREPQSKNYTTQQALLLENLKQPQEQPKERFVSLKRELTKWFPPCSSSPQQEVREQTTTPQTTHQEDRPSSSTWLYDLGIGLEHTKVRPFIECSKG